MRLRNREICETFSYPLEKRMYLYSPIALDDVRAQLDQRVRLHALEARYIKRH